MGTGVTEAHGRLPNPSSFKVHQLMCFELIKLLDPVLTIFPEIEAARPGCPSGIQALCSLNLAVDKATKSLQYCRESSKLYLAATGDTIVRRFQRSSESLEKSLCEIKDMVPVSLELEINQIANDLSKSTYLLDSSEEEAGTALQQLLRKFDSTSASEDAFRTAAVKLNLTSQKEILIEKRSIKKLLVNVDAKDQRIKNILMYLYKLLEKYGDSVVVENFALVGEGLVNSVPEENSVIRAMNCTSMEDKPHKSCRENVSEAIILSRAAPPEEYRCPLSSQIMYDPVIIASGQTYERFLIQKWFDEGHDSCPKTGMKLSNQSMTPNFSLKDLISRWCSNCGLAISDPSIEPETKSWEYSSNSIASFGSSMNDFRLHMDFSNISLGSMNASCYSYSLHPNPAIGLSSMSLQTKNDYGPTPQSDANLHDTEFEFPSNLNELEWELQCKIVEDLKNSAKENYDVCIRMSGNVVKALARFLSDAHAQQDIRAEKDGSDLFLTLLRKNRQGVLNIREETLSFLAGLLRSEVTEEVLSSLEVLSSRQPCISKFVAPGVLDSILEIVDSPVKLFKEKAVKILSALSSSNVVCSQIVSLGCIPKLVHLLNDDDLSGNCILLLRKLCDFDEARISVVETKGCLASVAQHLESGSLEKQEHAVMILLSLCSQRVEYCEVVMASGIIPSLVTISVNGSKKGQEGAKELCRLLTEACEEDRASQKPKHDSSTNGSNRHDVDKKKRPSKLFRFFRKK